MHRRGCACGFIGERNAGLALDQRAWARAEDAHPRGNSAITHSTSPTAAVGHMSPTRSRGRVHRKFAPDAIDEPLARPYLAMRPRPIDLFIRTGGEQRISNFLLWQLAYTEL